jgi:hypothetical protein
MVGDAGGLFGGQQVAAGGLEEGQGGLRLERRRVGHVDDHLGAGQGLGEAFAGEGVDAGAGRAGHRLMAEAAEPGHHLGPDEARPADDHDLHSALRQEARRRPPRAAKPCPRSHDEAVEAVVTSAAVLFG